MVRGIGLLACSILLAGCAVAPPSSRYAGRYGDIYCDTSTPEIEAVREHLDQCVESICGHLRLDPPPIRTRVLLFPTAPHMSAFLRQHCPQRCHSHAACYETPSDYVITLYSSGDVERILRLLRHEVTHYVLASHFYDMPPWIDEGLACYFEPGQPYGRVNQEKLRRLLPSLSSADLRFNGLVSIPSGAHLALGQYAEAWGLTHYLMQHREHGVKSAMRYLRVVRSGPQACEDFEHVFGSTPGELASIWRRYIGEIQRAATGSQ